VLADRRAIITPIGEIADTMQLLETGILDRHGIRTIGVAGHPEGCPDIPDQAIRAALAWKNAFAQRTGAELYLVTQFCFEAEPIIRWDQAIQAEGNRLPIHIGIPLATITRAGHAKACGIGPSMRFSPGT
jgi:methylenetetrahydrofolate reductase (NADPH)